MATQQEGCHICKQNKPAQHDEYCNARANERTVLGSHPLEPGYEGLVSIAHNHDDEAKKQPLANKQPHQTHQTQLRQGQMQVQQHS